MSARLTAEERRWLAKDCPDIDYTEPGDRSCPSCDTHALNLVTTVERILTTRLAAVEALADLRRWLNRLDREDGGSWTCGRCGQAPESHAPGGGADTCVYDPVFTRVIPPGSSDPSGTP